VRVSWIVPIFAILLCSTFVNGAQYSLQILDGSDCAVPGAAVEILSASSGSSYFSFVTDAEGTIEASMNPPVTVRVKAPGFETLLHRIGEDAAARITLHLIPSILNTTIEVSVTDDSILEGTVDSSAMAIDRTGARTVYEAVDRIIPSAYVPRRGILGHGLGISNSISLRGLGGSPTTQLLVVIDGRPEVMGLMGHPIPDFYSMTDVGSVAVTAGPASVLYGNRAMGGAIEIKPSPPAPGFHTELTASIGSYYTGQDRLRHTGQLGRFHYGLAAGIDHTNGDRENSSFRNQDGALNFSYELTPVWEASLEGQYGHFNVEDPGTIQAPAPGQWSRVGRGGFSASLRNLTEQAWGSILFFSSHGHHMLYDGFRSVDSNTGFRVMETFAPVSGFEFDLGGDAARYGGRARDIASDYNYGEFHVSEGGGFARARWFVTGKLRVNAGFRYDHNSVFGGVTATEFGASYRLADNYAISLAVAKGFRNPTIRELYLFPAPTPTLEPEHLWNYQATVQMRPFTRMTAWITGYYADASNMIITTGRYPNLRMENSGRALNRGLEINARYQLMRRVRLSSGYAYLRSTNLAPYVPENKLNYSLDVDLNYAFISLGGDTVGRTWANAARSVRLSGYTIANLKCTIPAGTHWSIFAVVDNLFNREYEELAGYPMPGTNASGGFRIKF
jgi:outer membrane cobalamin receptor